MWYPKYLTHSLIAILTKLKLDARIRAIWKKKADSNLENTDMQQYATTLTLDPKVTHSVVDLEERLLENSPD